MLNPFVMVEAFLAFILALVLHEYGHSVMAAVLGDTTPLRNGRLSLSPRRHMSMVGTLVAIASSVSVLGGVGWGKPLDYDANRMRVNPDVGTFLVGIAGIVANVLVGSVVAIGLRFLPSSGAISLQWLQACPGATGGMLQSCLGAVAPGWELRIEQFLVAFVIANFILALINLIPCSPLDAYTIIFALLPAGPAIWLRRYVPVMELLLLVFFFLIPYILALVRIPFDPSATFSGWARFLAFQITGPSYAFYDAL